MRLLTDGEASAIRFLLASQEVSERERVFRSGVPSRTFERARRRAYSEGWVVDRYVPSPARIGKPCVSFVLSQPFADRLREVEDRWKRDRACVLLWRWEETLFGVFVADESAAVAHGGSQDREAFRRTFEVTSDTRQPEVPVFFDFEGAWARFTGLGGLQGYPHSLPAHGPSVPPPPVAEVERSRMAELVQRPLRRGATEGPLRVSPFFLPRSHQRLLRRGVVERRVFLNLGRIPPYQGRSIEQVAFVHGELLDGVSSLGLFRRLIAMRVLPFLFATASTKVIIGALSPVPSAQDSSQARPATLANLQRFLKSIEIVRGRVPSLEVVIDHRYDRLFVA